MKNKFVILLFFLILNFSFALDTELIDSATLQFNMSGHVLVTKPANEFNLKINMTPGGDILSYTSNLNNMSYETSNLEQSFIYFYNA